MSESQRITDLETRVGRLETICSRAGEISLHLDGAALFRSLRSSGASPEGPLSASPILDPQGSESSDPVLPQNSSETPDGVPPL